MIAPPPGGAAGRRAAILAAALTLFRQRGFHSVGIDEIGTAAGISGPGVYRHFPSKGAVLVALFDSMTERMLLAAEEIQKVDSPPAETLDRLVSFHAAMAVDERALLAVWVQDWQSTPPADQERLRRRETEYVGIWLSTLVRLRPELAPAEAQALVQAALGTINSVGLYDPDLPAPALQPVLSRAAHAVLASG